MKTLFLFLLFLVNSMIVLCQVNSNYHYVNGYTRKDGTVVQGYYRTNPNATNTDNYSTKPNTNPWTGKPGTIEPDNYSYPSTYTTTPTYTTSPSYTTKNSYNYTPSSTPSYTPSSSSISIDTYKTYNYKSSYSTNSAKSEEIKYHDKYSFDDKLAIEQILYNLGCSLGIVDGVFTASTIYAIQSLQSFLGIQSDGKFGNNTLNKILEL